MSATKWLLGVVMVMAVVLALRLAGVLETGTHNVPQSELPNPVKQEPPVKMSAKIAFTSLRDGNDEIYVMNADGSDQRRLTYNNAPDLWPSWSPR